MGLSQNKRTLTTYLEDVRSDILDQDINDLNAKQKRRLSRHKTTYSEFLKCCKKLSDKFGSRIAGQFVWVNEDGRCGILCQICSKDPTLHGLFCGVVCTDFNYTKMFKHTFCMKHMKRLTAEQKQWYNRYTPIGTIDKFEAYREQETELKSFLNLMSLCYHCVYTGYAMYTIEMLQEFISSHCNGIMYDKYNERTEHKALIQSINRVITRYDIDDVSKWIKGHGVGLSFDGNSKKYHHEICNNNVNMTHIIMELNGAKNAWAKNNVPKAHDNIDSQYDEGHRKH